MKNMTLCTMLVEQDGEFINHIFLTADTRIIKGERSTENFTDQGQKIFNFTKEVIVAIAGDYSWFLNQIKPIIETKISTLKLSQKTPEYILTIIKEILFTNSSDKQYDLDIFVIIRDVISKNLYSYVLKSSGNFNHQELGKGLHLIGLDTVKQNEFRIAYKKYTEEFKSDPKKPFNDVVPILRTYYALPSEDISTFVTALSIDRTSWRALDIESSPDDGVTWIYDTSMEGIIWSRSVNEREISRTTTNIEKIKYDLNTRMGSSKRSLNKR
ncbi:hypothetical protein [Priestia megaterium]|uniref:hypothetical protein n=1 Tax=Priestia megaterium TaxID=1404 RepID=UPI002DBF2AA2|nr:hypothetical protein [Priestia megaterium]MEC1071320.1 hypothetical protein [Priestia megaterium]